MRNYSISFEFEGGHGAFPIKADNREDARTKAREKLNPNERITSIVRLDDSFQPYYKIGGGYV